MFLPVLPHVCYVPLSSELIKSLLVNNHFEICRKKRRISAFSAGLKRSFRLLHAVKKSFAAPPFSPANPAEHPQGVRRSRKAAKLPTAAQRIADERKEIPCPAKGPRRQAAGIRAKQGISELQQTVKIDILRLKTETYKRYMFTYLI